MKTWISLLLLLIACACGPSPAQRPPVKEVVQPIAAPPPPPPPPPPPVKIVPGRTVVMIQSASIDGKKSDGADWDVGKASMEWTPAAAGPLSAYAQAHPELTGTEKHLGQPVEVPGLAEDARKSGAADPMVLVEVGQVVYRSPMVPSQFQPVWRFPLLVDLPSEDEVLRITVVDWDGPALYDVVGERSITAKELLATRTQDLPRFGNVERLTIEAAPATDLIERSHRISIGGKPLWTVTPVELVAGQAVTILATGEVCLAGDDKAKCAGPDGLKYTSDYNVAGFEQVKHGALIGAVGDTRFLVGRELRFTAPSSGPLILGLNDQKADNNRGEIELSITVN